MKTRDIDIRIKLHESLRKEFREDTTTIIVDELPLCLGDARVDIAVVNGSIHGYEIKSESDTLKRLPQQVHFYSKIFDYVTLVCDEGYRDKLENMIPKWWGIRFATKESNGVISFVDERPASENDSVDLLSLLQLLWRNELLILLDKYDLGKGVRSKRKWEICEKLAQNIQPIELKRSVRECLKGREDWRTDSLQRLCDDLHQPESKYPHCQY